MVSTAITSYNCSPSHIIRREICKKENQHVLYKTQYLAESLIMQCVDNMKQILGGIVTLTLHVSSYSTRNT